MKEEFKSIIVIGGEGFLGHHLVTALIKKYPNSTIWSFDLKQTYLNSNPIISNEFIKADLTSNESIQQAFELAKPDAVFHTASPWSGSSFEVCQNVNVTGTINLIKASQSVGVKRFIYTSSAGVVFNGNHLINVDERLPIPKIGCDHYNTSKAKAEAIVLEANGKDSLLTCAIRPAGIFGPGDRQTIPGMIQVLKNRKDWIQIGDNKNLFDWTYVDNVVHAHMLALEKLDQKVPLTAFETTLSPIFKTIQRRNLLTSAGDVSKKVNDDNLNSKVQVEESIENLELIHLPDEMQTIESDLSASVETSKTGGNTNPTSWINGNEKKIDLPLPSKRHRWDQWAPISTQINYPNQFVPVAGQAFFITGGEPLFFWDFARSTWQNYSKMSTHSNLNTPSKFKLVIPSFLAIFLALLVQLWSKISGRNTLFTVDKVRYTCVSKYYNIEKARVVLGYEPLVGVEEGIQKAVEWYILNESMDQTTQADIKKEQ